MESEKQNDRNQQRSNWPGLARYTGMGVELAGAIIALTLAGMWVDHQFGTGRKALITGAILGIVGGFYNFLRQALELSRRQRSNSKDRKTGDSDDTI